MVDWSIYEDILREMILPELNSPKAIKEYQEAVLEIRERYNTRAKVTVSYEGEIYQKAYFIAYFPAYAYQMYDILNGLPKDVAVNLLTAGELRTAFIGAGPGSEFYGFYNFLRKFYSPKRFELFARFIEREKTWIKYLKAQKERVYNFLHFSSTSLHPCDISNCVSCLNNCTAYKNGVKFVSYQNILNESTLNDRDFLDGVEKLMDKLGENGIIVFSETKYPRNQELLQKVKHQLLNKFPNLKVVNENLVQSREVKLPYNYHPQVLKIFDKNIKLFPRKNVKYYSLVLRKAG